MTRNKEHVVIASMMAARVQSIAFTNAKQMAEFKKDLTGRIDQIFDAQKAAWVLAKAKAASAKAQRIIAQAAVCGRWAETQLKPNDLVSFRKIKGRFEVLKLDGGIMCVPVALLAVNGGTAWTVCGPIRAFQFDQIEKICHEGKWLDVYAVASGS